MSAREINLLRARLDAAESNYQVAMADRIALAGEVDLLRYAVIELYDFMQNEFEAEPHAHTVGSYVRASSPESIAAADLVDALLVARDEGLVFGADGPAAGRVEP